MTTRDTDPSGAHGHADQCSIQAGDKGRTWPVKKTLDTGESAYSELAVLPDGTVHCLYEKGSDIVAARFNLAWLVAAP